MSLKIYYKTKILYFFFLIILLVALYTPQSSTRIINQVISKPLAINNGPRSICAFFSDKDYTNNIKYDIYGTSKTIVDDTTPPEINITFTGNLSDDGGPYWLPPGETTKLTQGGYYANDSRQQEGWIYINATVVDSESSVTNVWLNWLNGSTWTNWTYPLVHTVGDYWEFNTSGNITTYSGYNYSFDIVANNTVGSIVTWWNKTGSSGSLVRRTVQLNCTTTNISYYSPFYLYNASYTGSDKKDMLHRDQGLNGTQVDTGYFIETIPNDVFQRRWCSSFTAAWIDTNYCVMSDNWDNVYVHFWLYDSSAPGAKSDIWVYKTVDIPETEPLPSQDKISFDINVDNHSSLLLPVGLDESLKPFGLCTGLIIRTKAGMPDYNFTDNSIYEFALGDEGSGPNIASNRSFTSFILVNVPDNETLNSTYPDSDSDSLSDWIELYVTYTNPFLVDTDNDGSKDNIEILNGTDPNKYVPEEQIEPRIPDLKCEGSLTFSNVKPGSTIKGDFKVKNIGGADSLLNWTIDSFPSWGTWIFDPYFGVNLTTQQEFIINVTGRAPNNKNTKFEGYIQVINKGNPNDYDSIPVFIKTSENRVLSLVSDLLKNHPYLPILRFLFLIHK